MTAVDAQALKRWLHDGGEIALFDVREHGQYGEAHLFHATPVPYSRLEIDAPRLAPRRGVRLVVYDEDGAAVAPRAAARLVAIGYTQVHVLQGGTRAWQAAGYPLFAGVNVPTKAFGEMVEHARHTPRISADELAARLARGEPLQVLDGRPLGEFHKMSIPTAICCPNGELALRVRGIVPDERTPIVVNCAGRTRSIIGAQTLIDLGLPNPVMALENGTQGWYLAGHVLDHGRQARYGEPAATPEVATRAKAWAIRAGVRVLDERAAADALADGSRSVFLFDVRTAEEFAQGSLPGARHAPGGQLVQALDQYAGVRGARFVLFDSDGVRAPMMAAWLAQMGHEVAVLEAGIASRAALARPAEPTPPTLRAAPPAEVAARLARGEVVLVDLRASMEFRKRHAALARWSIRPRLARDLALESRPVVLMADTPALAAWAALELPGKAVEYLEGGLPAWSAAGLPTSESPDVPLDADCIDYLFFTHDRHDGNAAAARQYLAWETALLGQLDEQETGAWRIVTPRPA